MFAKITLIIFLAAPGLLGDRDTGKDEKLTQLAKLLGRTCVAEIGFEGQTAECELMWSINQKNAIRRNRSLERQTLKFNSYWKVKEQRKRRPWIKYLGDGGAAKMPRRWPSTINWDRYRGKWIEIEKAALGFVHSNRQRFYDCPQAVDYGAPGESPDMGIVKRIKCLQGKTRQRYWAFK